MLKIRANAPLRRGVCFWAVSSLCTIGTLAEAVLINRSTLATNREKSHLNTYQDFRRAEAALLVTGVHAKSDLHENQSCIKNCGNSDSNLVG